MVQQEPHLAIIPLLNEEQLNIFFCLAMEAWQIIQGVKEGKRGETRTEDPDDNETKDIPRAI